MAVRIRLTRVGARNNPIWRVVATDQRALVAGERLEHRRARIDVQRRTVLGRDSAQRAGLDEQFAVAVGDVRGAGQHQRTAEAGRAAGVALELGADAAELGSISGPFWPHALASAATASQEHTVDAAFRPAATLISRCNMQQFYGQGQ